MTRPSKIFLIVWLVGTAFYFGDLWFNAEAITMEYDYTASTWRHIYEQKDLTGAGLCTSCMSCHKRSDVNKKDIVNHEFNERKPEIFFCSAGWIFFTVSIMLAKHFHDKNIKDNEERDQRLDDILKRLPIDRG